MTDEDDEPELFVIGGETDDAEGTELADAVDAAADAGIATRVDLASTLTSDDVAGDDWADTSWLDELAPPPAVKQAERSSGPVAPATSAGGNGNGSGSGDDQDVQSAAAAALSAMRHDRGADGRGDDAGTDSGGSRSTNGNGTGALVDPAALALDAVVPGLDGGDGTTPSVDDATGGSRQRRRPTTRTGDEVSEFLRELSRLALDED